MEVKKEVDPIQLLLSMLPEARVAGEKNKAIFLKVAEAEELVNHNQEKKA